MLKQLSKICAAFLICGVILLLNPIDLEFKPFREAAPKEKRTSNKGIYITANVVQTPKIFNRIKAQAKECGLDTIVIDTKMILSQPVLEIAKNHALTPQTKLCPNPWLAKLTKQLHDEGFIVVARLVVFKDDHLVIARPDLAIKVKGGALYRDHKQGRWADPYSEEVRLYNELIAEIAALSGVDEIQFDYIRFPAEGKAYLAQYPASREGISKVDAICLFLESVKNRVEIYNVSIAVDIFGITAWQRKNDIENLGQDLKRMAKHIDVLSPMFYPSHFHAGYDGFENPGEHPYYFIYTGVKKTKEILSSESVAIVPWLQGFNLRSPNYGPNYISEQIRAGTDQGVERFLIWNARNDYWAPFSALKKN